jgi:hypothetical protein
MENLVIEQLDRYRYSLIKWITIGFAVWYATNIISDFVNHPLIKIVATLTGLAAWVVWTVMLIKVFRLAKKINKNGFVQNALNDELFQRNRNKGFIVGFWSLLITTSIFLGITSFVTIPALLVCKVTLYVGVLSALIAIMFYNRD